MLQSKHLTEGEEKKERGTEKRWEGKRESKRKKGREEEKVDSERQSYAEQVHADQRNL